MGPHDEQGHDHDDRDQKAERTAPKSGLDPVRTPVHASAGHQQHDRYEDELREEQPRRERAHARNFGNSQSQSPDTVSRISATAAPSDSRIQPAPKISPECSFSMKTSERGPT